MAGPFQPALAHHAGASMLTHLTRKHLCFPGLVSGATLVLPRAFGLVILSNLVLGSLTTFYLGFGIVGAARKKYGISKSLLYPSRNVSGINDMSGEIEAVGLVRTVMQWDTGRIACIPLHYHGK